VLPETYRRVSGGWHGKRNKESADPATAGAVHSDAV